MMAISSDRSFSNLADETSYAFKTFNQEFLGAVRE